MTLDLEHLKPWIGRTESRVDVAGATPVQALAATLDRDDPPPQRGDPIPPSWHWLYFLPLDRRSTLGAEGHPKRGGFLPPVPLPRRMWAGSRIAFHRPLTVGSTIRRDSRIVDVGGKTGRSGPLVFVRVRHEVSDDGGLALIDEQDIVYRDQPTPGDAAPLVQAAPAEAAWSRRIVPDEVLLFRYSALTFNGHRIHYDRRYATAVEGYPGLVVHGPLLATLMLDLLRQYLPQATVAHFAFKAMAPVFDTASFQVCGHPADDGKTMRLWVRQNDGTLAMDATATLA